MAEQNQPDRSSIDWGWLITMALVIGVAPAIGRDVSAELRETWGRWPAMFVGVTVAGVVALLVLAVSAIVRHSRRQRSNGERPKSP